MAHYDTTYGASAEHILSAGRSMEMHNPSIKDESGGTLTETPVKTRRWKPISQ